MGHWYGFRTRIALPEPLVYTCVTCFLSNVEATTSDDGPSICIVILSREYENNKYKRSTVIYGSQSYLH
jgi:hypothetical protein